jgi:hypothetical protein
MTALTTDDFCNFPGEQSYSPRNMETHMCLFACEWWKKSIVGSRPIVMFFDMYTHMKRGPN